MKPTNIKRKRILRNMIFITSILCFLLIVRIGVIQFVQGSELQSMAYSQQTLNRKINPMDFMSKNVCQKIKVCYNSQATKIIV